MPQSPSPEIWQPMRPMACPITTAGATASAPRHQGMPWRRKNERHRQRAPHEAAVEDEAAAGEERAERIPHECRPVLEHQPHARADQAAGRTPQHPRRREVAVVPLAVELPSQHVARRHEGDREHHAEEMNRDRTEVKDVRDHPGAPILPDRPGLRHSRLPDDRALRRACEPWCNGCAKRRSRLPARWSARSATGSAYWSAWRRAIRRPRPSC